MSAARRAYAGVRNNWRVVLLIVLILIATYFLFVPGATLGETAGFDDGEEAEADRLTNLRFGIDLAGGSRITAPVYGYTAEDVGLESGEEAANLELALASSLEIDQPDVRADPEDDTVEVFDPDVEGETFEATIAQAGYEDVSIRDGVTGDTRSDVVDVLSSRIDAAGFAGGSVTQQSTGDGWFIVAQWPGSSDELAEVMSDRGVVQVLAHYPDDDGYTEEVALGADDIDSVNQVQWSEERSAWQTPLEVTEAHAGTFVQVMQQGGFDTAGGWSNCEYPPDAEEPPQERPEDGWGHCLLIEQDGEVLSGYGVRQNLGESFAGSDPNWLLDRSFVISVQEQAEAEEVRVNLQEGALAAQPNLNDSQQLSISPALAERFLQNSLLTGVLAVLAVVLMVFMRYGDPRVAAPMSITALSELYLLLGFAGMIGMSLDLAVMAGFIAVVGTGVDDLIIIADEVMGQHDVRSQRVFDSRFRKAFWVIGAAAATTIIAMSPLAVLDLGDLRGFAIITILGVLIGVVITRPAYGNILRWVKTET